MTPTIKKRKYSRAGCDECKRRKMKCDEAKPFCYNCTRLHKACVYRVRANSAAPNGPSLVLQLNFGPQFKLYLPKTKKEDKGKSDKINTGAPGPDVARISEDSGPIADTALDAEMTLSQGDLQSIFNDAWLLVNSITDLPLELDKAAVEVGLIIAFEGNGGEDHGGKGTGGRNGNGNVSSITELTQTDAVNAPSQSSQPFQPSPLLNPSPNTLFDSFTSFPNVTVSPVQSTSITDLIDHIIAHHSLATPHSTYLQALNETVVSKSFFPFALSSADNVVTNLLLQYANQCPYLLSALLAMIATVQFNVSGDVHHELCGQKYVLVCLKSLSRAFATTDSTSRTSHIERLLLTVMLLTSIFSSKTYENVVSSWKTHLRGAKDLLMRYSGSGTNISAGLALAKTWFFAIDSLAVITTKLGGTVKESAIFKETGYFNRGAYHDALQELGLVLDLPSGCKYNLFLGFSMEFVLFLEHFSKCLDTLRAGADITYRDVTHKMSLVNQVQFTEILPGVDYHTYVVSETSPAHPRSGLMSLPASAYGIVTSSPFHSTASNASPDSFHESISTSVSPSISPGSSNANSIGNSVVNSVNSIATNSTTFSNTIVYSWYDISQQCRCNAIYLRFLLLDGLLPTTNKRLIQQLVDNIMNCLFFVLPKTQNYYDSRRELVIAETEHYFISSDLFDTRCYMIQSAFRVVTGLVVEEDSLERLELFFKGLIKLGNGLAMEALQRVADRRQMVREGHIEMKVNWAEVVPFN